MDEQLQNTLTAHAHPRWQSNPAMHQIIDGYAKYHATLAAVGALFVLILLVSSVIFWIRFKRVTRISRFRWPFEKKVYFCFATLLTFVALLLALITAGNITNAAKPLPGFIDSIPSITTNSYNRQLHASFNDWIVSGKSTPPALVQQRIQHRRVFHAVRAIVSGILLVAFTILSVRLWESLIAYRGTNESKWTLKEVGWLAAGVITVILALCMMIAFMANFQSVVAPIANTLQFG